MVIGVPNDKAQEILRSEEDCFGQHFAKTADECKRCIAPVLHDGRVKTVRDLCRAECEDSAPDRIKRLTSDEVLDLVRRGREPVEIWAEILDGQPPPVAGVEARSLMAARLRYLSREKGLQVPEPPTTQELKDELERRS